VVATFSPTKVFPDPGTPVTKQIILLFFVLACVIIREMTDVVFVRFFASASLLVISLHIPVILTPQSGDTDPLIFSTITKNMTA
jgi:hypothetical protein